MTNEKKARKIAEEYRAVLAANTDFDVNDLDLAEEDVTRLTLEMAQWKDEQFTKQKQALIDNACEWLKDNADDFIEFGNYTDDSSGVSFHIDSLIDNFRKAMEGMK